MTKALTLVAVLVTSGELAEAAFANGADAELNDAVTQAHLFAGAQNQSNAQSYFNAMRTLMVKIGNSGIWTDVVFQYLNITVATQF